MKGDMITDSEQYKRIIKESFERFEMMKWI